MKLQGSSLETVINYFLKKCFDRVYAKGIKARGAKESVRKRLRIE